MKNRTDSRILIFIVTLGVVLVVLSIAINLASSDHDQTASTPTPVSSNVSYVSADVHAPFGGDKSALADDVNAAINELYRMCHEQPEVLAATMSAFPDVLTDLQLADIGAEALDDAMDGERGGEIQRTLLEKLKALLEEPTTEITFAECDGYAYMIYMVKRDESDDVTPSNLTLVWEHVKLEGNTIMTISVPRADGAKESGDFDMNYGFQRVALATVTSYADEST